MGQIKIHLQNRFLGIVLLFVTMMTASTGCKRNVVDFTMETPKRQWFYRNHVSAPFEIKNHNKAYNIYLKLRHSDDYRYANIFVLAHFIDGKQKITKRYEYKLAEKDGKWLGSGSGNIFNYTLPMLTNHRFTHNGKYTIDIEQNMRDNPLKEITDVGILVEEAGQN
ncbi:gliding motility-associated lipoprotein GldH [Pedobacter sp. UYEF25]